MGRQRIHWDTREREKAHREKVIRKAERIAGLRALLEMWEELPDSVDRDYLPGLRARLRSAENQLAAMRL